MELKEYDQKATKIKNMLFDMFEMNNILPAEALAVMIDMSIMLICDCGLTKEEFMKTISKGWDEWVIQKGKHKK